MRDGVGKETYVVYLILFYMNVETDEMLYRTFIPSGVFFFSLHTFLKGFFSFAFGNQFSDGSCILKVPL